jgi:hypothetical protein
MPGGLNGASPTAMISVHQNFRASPEIVEVDRALGPLAQLSGRWVGKGVNLVLLPAKGSAPPFRRLVNATLELLDFSPLSLIPNRGSVHNDIFFSGLTYLQQITDLNTLEEIHVESGQWLLLPETDPPSGNASIVRQATILHGDTLLAQGPIPQPSQSPGPTIDPTSLMPTFASNGQPLNDAASQAILLSTALPPGVPPSFVADPNQFLRDAIQGKTFITTQTLRVAADASRIVNIPFVQRNANVTSFEATFWIETIQQPTNSIMNTLMQLQYSQTVNLLFDGINWPHISVATLIKQ